MAEMVASNTQAESVKPKETSSEVSLRSWIALMGGMLGSFMAILDIQITNSSLKDIQGALSATLDESSWIATSYLVAEMVAIPLSGWLSKTLGKRRYLTGTTVIFGLSSLLCSFAWNMPSMIAFRAIQGFSGGALIPLAFSLVVQLLPLHKRALGMTLFGITATFAPSIGPTLGGWLTENFSWHFIFYINLVPAIAVIAMVRFGLDDEKINIESLRNADWAGILLMGVGLGCLEVVLEEGSREEWFSSTFITALSVIAVVCITYFIINELYRKDPLVNLRLLGNQRFAMACFTYLILGMGLMGSIYVIPLYLTEIQHYNALEIGEVLMWMGFPQLLIFPFVPKVLKFIKPKYLAAFGFGMFALSCWMNTHMTADFGHDQLVVSMLIRAVGSPFMMVSLSMVAMQGVPKPSVPDASTLTNIMRNLGGAFGIAIIATLLDNKAREHLAHVQSSLPSVSSDAWYYLQQQAQFFIGSGSDPVTANLQANSMLMSTMYQNGRIMAYNDIFVVMTAFLSLAAVMLLVRKEN